MGDTFEQIVRHFGARHCQEAAAAIDAAMHEPEAASLARRLVDEPKLFPIAANVSEAAAMVPVYEAIVRGVQSVAPADGQLLADAQGLLATACAIADRPAEAAELFEKQFLAYVSLLGTNHPRTHHARENLTIQYRRLGRHVAADQLHQDIRICEHLQPVLDDLLKQGAKISSAGVAWSQNCRTWVYLADVLLDVDSLRQRLNLPAEIEVHTHRGTHDGSEHGLYCSAHHDAIMGRHPDLAGGCRTLR